MSTNYGQLSRFCSNHQKEIFLRLRETKDFISRFIKLHEWHSIFLNSGFHLHRYYGFYHPVEVPGESYLSYKSYFRGLKSKVLMSFFEHVSREMGNQYLNRSAGENLGDKVASFGKMLKINLQ